MQRSWRTDADKLTFIACTALLTTSPHDIQRVQPTTHDAPDRMIGDVNLFLCEAEDASDDEDAGSTPSKELPRNIIGEVEIMIARTDLHGSGYGKAILLTFLAYILSNLPALLVEYGKTLDAVGRGCSLRFLRVKIDGENARSIRLFESVGFRKMSEKVNYFGELELRWDVKGGEVEEPRGVEMRCLEYSTENSKET
jgi:ribosomal protein S18 acetylase RimI-like enzyme